MEVGDRVKLPLDETGTIVNINRLSLDFFPYKVRLRKVNPLFGNKTNQILEYKREQLNIEL